jgi:hypothetical protein
MYVRCGEQYRRRYIEGEKQPPGVAMVKGTAVHKGAEDNLNYKVDTGELLPEEQVLDSTRDALAQGLSEVEEKTDKEASDAVDSSIRMAKAHYEHLAPVIAPVKDGVEAKFKVDVGLPLPMLGFIDVIEYRDGKYRVRDLKTSAKKPADAVANSLQLVLYDLHLQQRGLAAEYPVLDYIVDQKSGTKVMTMKRDKPPPKSEGIHRLVSVANNVLDGISRGVFHPADPDSWRCSEKFCGYADTCPYFQGKPTVTWVTTGD